MTTRFSDDEFLGSLMGTIHETGHGRYEQNLPREWLGQPMAERARPALHEKPVAQLRDAAGQPPGLRRAHLAPLVARAFGEPAGLRARQPAPPAHAREAGLIRVDADEVTYPAHIILRYEIERPLIEGEIEVDDIPRCGTPR